MVNRCVAIESPELETAHLHQSFNLSRAASDGSFRKAKTAKNLEFAEMAEEGAVYVQACNPSRIARWHMFRTADSACSSDCRALLQGDAAQVFDGNPARLYPHNLFIVCLMSNDDIFRSASYPESYPGSHPGSRKVATILVGR
jgi:hypothetical protein